MKYIFSIFLLILSLLSFSQENSYNDEIIILQEKLKNTENIEAKIIVYKEIIKLSFTDYPENLNKYSKQLLQLAINNNIADAKAFANYYLGEYSLYISSFEESEKYFNEALLVYEQLENKSQIAKINCNLGLTSQYLNKYDESLKYYQKSIEIFESIGNKEKAAINYHDIGTLYNDLEKYSLSIYYYEKALAIYEEYDNEERIAAIYQNIGVLHYNWGNLDQSISYYQRSLNIYEKIKDKRCIAISLSNIGLVYEENKHYNKALIYYEKSLLMFEEINNKQALVYIFYNLGSIYRNLNKYNKSINYFDKGLSLSRELKMKDYVSYNYEALSGIYAKIGQNKKALNYYKDYIDVKYSIFNDDKFNQIEDIEAKFQNAQHKKEIEFLKLNQNLKDSKLQKKEAQNLILIFSSFLIFIIAVILFLFNRLQKRSSNRLELEVNERKKTEENLSKLTNELEKRVKERTSDIEKSNQKLLYEVEQHKQTMQNLEIAKNKAEESDKIKSSFLANISHEIRTPLNAILGFSQMLERNNLSVNKRRDFINKIRQGCNGLTHLIEDIIDFASIESGEAKIEIQDFNPHPIMEFLHDHYTNELLKQNKELIKLNYENENTENDLIIDTDPVRLKQILSIFIDNSIKFTDSGRIDFGFIHSGNDEIEFYVKDTGIGIDKKYRKTIFERFRQVDESTTKEYGGAGIGLSVAKSLVEMLNGEVWFESTLGVGSTFFVKLPYKGSVDNNIFIDPATYDWKGKVILVAEDKKINYEIINETLSITNVGLLWAKNGQEAIDMVKSNKKIDLILMDIQMPVMDGYESTQKIKLITPDIPIIAQTAYALPQENLKCFESGCDDFIAKPISLNQFLIKLDKYLS